MYYTGLRIGEMQALKWEDYENGYITVNKEFNERTEVHHGELKEPKTASSYRDVALGQNINKLLSDCLLSSNELLTNSGLTTITISNV